MTMRSLPRVHNGTYLLAIGALHQLVGILAGLGVIAQPGAELRKPLLEIVQAGVVDAVEPDAVRIGTAWFLLFGCAVLMLGSLVRWYEVRSLPLPKSLAVHLTLLTLLGVVLMPVSGFWLCLPVAYRLLRYAQRTSLETRAVHTAALQKS